jgi:hypothetical protein
MPRLRSLSRRSASQARARLAKHWLPVTVVAAVLGFVAITYFVLKLAPDWFAETHDLDPKGRAVARQGVRTASLALFAGALAVIGSIYTARTFALNRAGQLTDRFTKAIEQLGHTELDVRLGGIYALERIARDSEDDHPQVVEVLTAYIRQHAPRTTAPPSAPAPDDETATAPPQNNPAPAPPRPATDVQAALTVLGRRTLEHEKDATPDLDMAGTQLAGARLYPPGTGRPAPNLSGADLSKANLSEANLTGANLSKATLSSAILTGAHLGEANLSEATLSKANLADAILSRANLRGANLSHAILGKAHLRGADLSKADLRGAILRGADLDGADVNDAKYDRPHHDGRHTAWPHGYDPDVHGARAVTDQDNDPPGASADH